MSNLLRIVVFWAVALAVLPGAAAAQLPTPPVPGCQYAYSGIYPYADTEPAAEAMRTYQGTTLNSVEQLIALTRQADSKTILIEGGDFSGWSFAGQTVTNICFVESDLSGSDWRGATATGLGFIKSSLAGANLSGAKMQDILIRSSDFSNVDASDVDWSSGKLDGGWDGNVENLTIDGANLTGFKFVCGITIFDGCPLTRNGISARKTDLSFADIATFGFYDADWTGAILNRTMISPRQLTTFQDANNSGPVIVSGAGTKIFVLPETWSLLMQSALAAAADEGASFDCGKARTPVEREICGEHNSSLRAQDRAIASLYAVARKRDRGVKAAQKAWLKQRDACAAQQYPTDCLREAYSNRKGALLARIGELNWLPAGEEALFVEEVLPLGSDITESASYAQLAPVLAGAARAQLLVIRNPDGSLDAKGDAVGANAHLCSLQVQGARFDKITGWYTVSVMTDDGPKNLPAFRYWNDRIEIYRNGKPRFDESDDRHIDFVSCGARASFPELMRIGLQESDLAHYRGQIAGDR